MSYNHLPNYNKKLSNYYCKVKRIIILINNINDDINDVDNNMKLYNLYLQLLLKMKYYNNKIQKIIPDEYENIKLNWLIRKWIYDTKQKLNVYKKQVAYKHNLSILESKYLNLVKESDEFKYKTKQHLIINIKSQLNDILDYTILLNKTINGNKFKLSILYSIKTDINKSDDIDFELILSMLLNNISDYNYNKLQQIITNYKNKLELCENNDELITIQNKINEYKQKTIKII